MKSESLVHRIRGDFDWSSLRYPGERTVRTEIERDPILHEMALEHANPRLTLPAGFLQGGLSVTPAVTPAIHRVIELLRQVLQIDAKIDVEIVPHTERLVELTPDSKPSAMTLRVSAPLLSDATLRETLFLLGRKIGHALVGQVRLYRDPAAGRQDARRETLLLRGLWRFQELACDRFGVICCQDLDVAIRALVRQTSGLPMSLLSISREDWLRERPFEDESMISPRENDFLMLRVASLERFVESDKYTAAFDEQWLDAAPVAWNDEDDVEAVEADVEESDSASVPTSVAAMVKELSPRIVEEIVASTPRPAWEAPSPFVLPTVDKGQSEVAAPAEPPVSRNTPISPVPISPTSQDPVVEYRMIGDDPSVVKQVYTFPTGAAAPKRPDPPTAVPLQSFADNDASIRRSFTVHAAFWLISLQDSVSKLQQSLLVDLFGNQVYSEVRPGYEEFGDEVFAKFCRESAGKMRRLDRATRQDMLRELTRIMMTDNGDLARSEPVLQEIADILGLVRDDMTMALSEFVDPEYADYTFHPGELVDVHLDGEWVTGVVESVDADSGDIRVRFTASGKALRLHPLADLIRPKAIKQAS